MANQSYLSPKLYFSFGQFLVFDRSVKLPGCEWTDDHFAQGFARRDSNACFRTLDEFGHAEISAHIAPYAPSDEYARVIAVPFLVQSGLVVVEGPEEFGTGRTIELPVGAYRLVAAQAFSEDDEEAIDLFFEPRQQPALNSEILVRDDELDPPIHLIEGANVAGEG